MRYWPTTAMGSGGTAGADFAGMGSLRVGRKRRRPGRRPDRAFRGTTFSLLSRPQHWPKALVGRTQRPGPVGCRASRSIRPDHGDDMDVGGAKTPQAGCQAPGGLDVRGVGRGCVLRRRVGGLLSGVVYQGERGNQGKQGFWLYRHPVACAADRGTRGGRPRSIFAVPLRSPVVCDYK